MPKMAAPRPRRRPWENLITPDPSPESAPAPAVLLLQTLQGDDTLERWADICLS